MKLICCVLLLIILAIIANNVLFNNKNKEDFKIVKMSMEVKNADGTARENLTYPYGKLCLLKSKCSDIQTAQTAWLTKEKDRLNLLRKWELPDKKEEVENINTVDINEIVYNKIKSMFNGIKAKIKVGGPAEEIQCETTDGKPTICPWLNYNKTDSKYCWPSSSSKTANIKSYITGTESEARHACNNTDECQGFTYKKNTGQYLLKRTIETVSSKIDDNYACFQKK